MNSDERLVTVVTFADVSQASLFRSQLEAAGIEYFLVGEDDSRFFPLGLSPVAGVKVQVKESDVEKAGEILDELDADSAAAEGEEEIEPEMDGLDEEDGQDEEDEPDGEENGRAGEPSEADEDL
jgi:hypothetical protein